MLNLLVVNNICRVDGMLPFVIKLVMVIRFVKTLKLKKTNPNSNSTKPRWLSGR